jgi:hypothetical protein
LILLPESPKFNKQEDPRITLASSPSWLETRQTGLFLVRPQPTLPQNLELFLTIEPAIAATNKFFEDFGVWKEAPVLIGSTKFEPLPDVKNIMITGGAGFM